MPPQAHGKRLLSLDAFRGATIAGMILVNSPGTYRAVYPQLQHALWNGWTFADLIFPFFLFIAGVSIAFSIPRRKSAGESQSQLLRGIIRRSIILFALGLFLNGYPIFHASTIRIPGVLQRISICYFVASLLVLKTRERTQAYWTAGLLVSYWLMMQFVPVPGVGAGSYEPGANFAAYVDSLFFTGHMWSGSQTWDPEGIISTIPAVATTLFGVLTGYCLHSSRSNENKTAWMLLSGLVLLLLGTVLGHWLPINKNIWTSSFSIFTAGWALICLAIFYWLIDVKGYRSWAKPFVIFGMNAIAAYVLSEVLDTSLRFIRLTLEDGRDISVRAYLFRRLFAPLFSPVNASLLFALSYTLLIFAVMWVMWKKQWFLKI